MSLSILRTRKFWFYCLFLLLFYSGFLISQLPAQWVLSHYKPGRQVSFSQVSGSVWQGSMQDVSVSRITLGKLDWQLDMLPLLTGSVSTHFTTASGANHIRGRLKSSGADNLHLEKAELAYSVESLMPLLYGMPVTATGQLNALINSLDFAKSKYLVADARLVISSLNITSIKPLSLGDIVIEISPDKQNSSKGIIKSSNGQIHIDGTLTVAADGKLSLQAYLTPATDDADIKAMLSMLGKPDTTNRYRFSWQQKLF